jgi:hypothetical protein
MRPTITLMPMRGMGGKRLLSLRITTTERGITDTPVVHESREVVNPAVQLGVQVDALLHKHARYLSDLVIGSWWDQ